MSQHAAQCLPPKRMKMLWIAIAFLLIAGAALRAQPPQQAGQTPPAAAQDVNAGAPAGQPQVEAEDPLAGYRNRAKIKETDFQKQEAELLPAIEDYGKKPCANAKPIESRIDILRKGAKEWVDAYQKYVDKWADINEKDIEDNAKIAADQSARQGDIPSVIKSAEDELQEFERRRAALPAEDENARKQWDELIEKSNARLARLRSASAANKSIEDNLKLSREYWDAKRETIRKDREIMVSIGLDYERKYDSILQHWRTACTQSFKPDLLKVGTKKN
jgi:hypothetical protein